MYQNTPTMATMKPIAFWKVTTAAKKTAPRAKIRMVLTWPTTWYVTALVFSIMIADEKFMGAAQQLEMMIHLCGCLAVKR